MRIASWNVNSLRVRLPHVLDWLARERPAVLGLQETKLTDDKFPRAEIEAAGYHVAFAGQPTYNGVALLADAACFGPPEDIRVNNPLFQDDQVRIIAATLTPKAGLPRPDGPRNDSDSSLQSGYAPVSSSRSGIAAEAIHAGDTLRFINAYIPNGSEVGSEKYAYKLRWLDAAAQWIEQELRQHKHLALVGDFNIAPQDQDVHDPQAWHEKILCSTPERERLQRLLDLGLQDAFRLFDQPAEQYSWWDYREAAFRRNRGLRIDLLLISQALAMKCRASGIDTAPRKLEKPSDHAPAWAELDWA